MNIVRRLAPAAAAVLVVSLLGAAPAEAADTGSISGRVLAKTGAQAQAYEGAGITLDRFRDDSDFFTDSGFAFGYSDASGRFTIADLPDGRYRIRTYPVQYGELGQLGYEYYDDQWSPYGAATVTVADGQPTTLGHTIELQPIGHVVGRVLDEHGDPVAGSVSVGQGDGGSYGVETEADGSYDTLDGEWSSNLIPGEYTLSFSPAAYDIDAPQYYYLEKTASVTAGGTARVDFTLVERPTATFTVRGSDGQPQANAPVRFWMRDDGGPWRSPQYGPILTDDQGRFRIADSADEFRLQFLPEEGNQVDVAEYWQDSYAFGDAGVVSFAGAVPLDRAYDVQLGAAPTIRPDSPAISGTAQVGQTLTLDPGTWSPAGVTTAVQWFAGDDPIGTGSELTLRPAQLDQWIWARVTGTAPGEASVDVHVDGLGPVTAGDPPVDFAVPSISGTARVGETLTAVPGAWGPSGVSLAYQWLADGQPIADATTPTLAVTPDLDGARVAVRVTGSHTDHTSVTRTSPAVVVGKRVITPGTPTVTGARRVGGVLTAHDGSWAPSGVVLTRQWLADGTPIAGATGVTYRPTNAVAGKRISVRLTGTLAAADDVSVTSAETAAVIGALTTVRPRITGSAKVGRTLTAKPGAWRPSPVTFGYQWLRNGKPIRGATGRTHRLGSADRGKRISVRVTGRKPSFAVQTLTSRPTGVVRRG